MVLPEAEVLLQVYYGLQWSVPFVLLSVFFGLMFFYLIGWYAGKKKTLYYIWTNGIPHSQKEYTTLYEKWKLKQKGIYLSD